jgi:hypothetical protein
LKKLKDTVKNLRMRILLKGKMMFDETKLPQPSHERQLREIYFSFPATAPPFMLYLRGKS